MLRSIAPPSTQAASHLCLSSADSIIIIAESNFRYTQLAAYGDRGKTSADLTGLFDWL
jgi:hypothetical protein